MNTDSGIIYCPASLIGIITPEVEDIEYQEVESRLLETHESVELDKNGLLTLWQKVCNLSNGEHEVQFSYMHGDSDLEVSGNVRIDESGIWMHDLKAMDEVCNEYQITFDAKYFNTYYLR